MSRSRRAAPKTEGDIFAWIDDLDESRTVQELVKRLKPILNQLAYSHVTGDASAHEVGEEWHEEFADDLYTEASGAYQQQPPQRAAPAPMRAPPRNRDRPEQSSSAMPEVTARLPFVPMRAQPGAVPASLMAIMQGTHDSLKN